MTTAMTLFESIDTSRPSIKREFIGPFPSEIWSQIFNFLDVKSIFQCAMVCKPFVHLTTTPDIWKLFCIQEGLNCGPGIELLLAKHNDDKGKWWKSVFIEGTRGRKNWLNGKHKKVLFPLVDPKDAITSLKYDHDKFIVSTKDCHLLLYDSSCLESFDNSKRLQPRLVFWGGHKTSIISVDYSEPVGNLLASGDSDGTLCVWNIFTGDLLARFKKAHNGGISRVLIHNQYIISSGFDKTIRIFTLAESTFLTQRFETSPVSSQSSLPDISQLPNPKKQSLIDRIFKKKAMIQPKTCIALHKELCGHKGEIFALNIVCEKYIASGATDCTVMVISTNEMWDLKRFDCKRVFCGHSATVTCIVSQNELLFTSSLDKTIRGNGRFYGVWNVFSGECVTVLNGHSHWIKSMHVQSSILISGGWDEKIHLWSIERLKLLKRINLDMGPVGSLQGDDRRVVVVCREEGFQHCVVLLEFGEGGGYDIGHFRV